MTIAHIIFFCSVIPTSTPAIDAHAMQLDTAQGALSLRLAHLEEISTLHHRLTTVRDGYVTGAQGITTATAAWFDAVSTWLTNWTEILAFIDVTAAHLTELEIRQHILSQIRSQHVAWEALRHQAQALHQRTLAAEQQAATLVPVVFLAGDADVVLLLNREADDLRSTLATLRVRLSAPEVQPFAAVVAPTQEAVLVRLRQALTQAPEIQAAVDLVEHALRAEQDVQPWVTQAEPLFDAVRDALLSGRIFAAEAHLSALQTHVGRAHEALAALHTIDATFKRPALQALQGWLTTAHNLLAERRRVVGDGASVLGYFAVQIPRVVRDCVDLRLRAQRNCILVQQLQALPPHSIASMRPALLRELETMLDDTQQPPRAL